MFHSILVLNSDQAERTVTSEALARDGYLVLQAGSLGEAVDLMKTCSPHLLVIRSYVDNMPGHNAARYLQRKCRGLRVLIVSGLIDDDRLTLRESLDGFAVVPKPFPVEELLTQARAMLSLPAHRE